MVGIHDEEHNTDELLIPALRALACVLTLARFHVHTSETLSLLKHYIRQFGQLVKAGFVPGTSYYMEPNTFIRRFVNLKPISTTRSFHSTGPRCTHSHTLLRAFAEEVSYQAIVVIMGKLSTLRTERITVAQIGRHQLKNRWVVQPIVFYFLNRLFNRCCGCHMSMRQSSRSGLRWIGMINTSCWVKMQPLVHYLTLQSQGFSCVLM